MKQSEKKAIIILIVVAIIIIAIVFKITNKEDGGNEIEIVEQSNDDTIENQVVEENVELLPDGTKLNTSSKMTEIKEFEGMQISDLQLTSKDGISQILATVTNNSSSEQGGYPILITILDKDGKTITEANGYIKSLQAGESTQLNASKTFDYANAYDYKITKK